MNEEEFLLDEFVSFELKEDKDNDQFFIILKGRLKYCTLIANKIGNVTITKTDIDEFVTKEHK